MARQRRLRAAPKRGAASAAIDDDGKRELAPEMVAAHAHARVDASSDRIDAAKARLSTKPKDRDARRELAEARRENQEAQRERDGLVDRQVNEIIEAFKRTHGGRIVVAVETFTPPAQPTSSKRTRLQGEAPTERVRVSQRPTPGRDARAKIAEQIGADPDEMHARIVDAHMTRLQSLRVSWPNMLEVRKLAAQIREHVSAIAAAEVVSANAFAQATTHIDELERLSGPSYCHSAEDIWLVMVMLDGDLNDDEIAQIVSPAGHLSDRSKALHAVRERRSSLERRAELAAVYADAIGETVRLPSSFQRRRNLEMHRELTRELAHLPAAERAAKRAAEMMRRWEVEQNRKTSRSRAARPRLASAKTPLSR